MVIGIDAYFFSVHNKNYGSVPPEEARFLRRLEGFNQNSLVF